MTNLTGKCFLLFETLYLKNRLFSEIHCWKCCVILGDKEIVEVGGEGFLDEYL